MALRLQNAVGVFFRRKLRSYDAVVACNVHGLGEDLDRVLDGRQGVRRACISLVRW